MNDWVATVSYALGPAVGTMDHWSEQFDATVSRVPDRGVVDVPVYAPAELHLIDVIARCVDSISEVVGAEPAGIEIVREDEWQRRAAAPTMPELMSAAEISDELGVARQRVHQLRCTAAFPAPLAELRGCLARCHVCLVSN